MGLSTKYDQRVLDLFDGYVHGYLDRRQFLDRAAAITASSATALALFHALRPNYALAQQVDPEDPAIEAGYADYESSQGAYYGRQANAADVPKINAPLLTQYAALDERINAGWPAYQEALDAAGKEYAVHFYSGTNHGFHNDTTPRYDAAAAELSWRRTIEFFREKLV